MTRYQVRLRGQNAKLGEIPASDVGKLLVGVQSVLARAAGSAIGHRVKSTGRWERTIEEETRLRLVRLRKGSVVCELQLLPRAPTEPEFELSVQSLGDLGWDAALDVVRDPGSGDPGLVLRLSQLAEELAIGEKYESLEFGRSGEHPGKRAELNGHTRSRLASMVQAFAEAPTPAAIVAGVLVEADFERKTAHVRTPTGDLVELVFDDDLADVIYEALRRRSEFLGDVTYDQGTNSIRSVRLRGVTRAEQLLLGDEATAFWIERSADDLVQDQGKETLVTFDNLRDSSLSDDEFSAFFGTFG